MNYSQEEDVLHILIANGRESERRELTPDIMAELNVKGELIGLEILNASVVIPNLVLAQVDLGNLKIAH